MKNKNVSNPFRAHNLHFISRTNRSSAASVAWHHYAEYHALWRDWHRGVHRWHQGLTGNQEE